MVSLSNHEADWGGCMGAEVSLTLACGDYDRTRAIKDGLSRLTESSILDRYS